MGIKKKDIEVVEDSGTFQMFIEEHGVTGYEHKTADDCYKSYIVKLLKKLEKIEVAMNS